MASTIEERREKVGEIYREESRRVFATLIRLLGDFDTAEDALHDAFAAALDQWPRDGFPENPRAWLVSTGRFKAIDAIRKRARFDASLASIAERLDADARAAADQLDETVKDDQLRLIFTCCHPALPPEGRVALTLREVCGLTTEEIAHAHLTNAATLAQRIVRAKNKIRDANIPYVVPSPDDLPERLETVLQVIYLVFNEGYFASSGDNLVRADLSGEAIRLGALLLGLLPEPEVMGLYALMLLQESRRASRMNSEGDLILLEDQDRSLWNRPLIEEGIRWIEKALISQRFGSYTLQAAIAAVHAEAASPEETDWPQIAALYRALFEVNPSPVVELNWAVATAMVQGPATGIARIEAILDRGQLADYQFAHSARAELLRRVGRFREAKTAYEKARSLATQDAERRFLDARISSLS